MMEGQSDFSSDFSHLLKQCLVLASIVNPSLHLGGDKDLIEAIATDDDPQTTVHFVQMKADTSADTEEQDDDVMEYEAEVSDTEQASFDLSELHDALTHQADKVLVLQELLENVVSLGDIFAKASRADQQRLSDVVCATDGVLECFYGLLFDCFEYTHGLTCDSMFGQMYYAVAMNIELWVDVSVSICEKIVYRGLLMQNVNHLMILFGVAVKSTSQSLLSALGTELGIIYNCAWNYPLPNFYFNRYKWGNLLSDIDNFSTDKRDIRVTCKFLATCLVSYSHEEIDKLLDMSADELLEIKKALHSAVSSTDMLAEAFGYRYSASELLKVLLMILSRPVNFKVVVDESFLNLILLIIQVAPITEKKAAFKILWRLMETSHEGLNQMHKDIQKILMEDGKCKSFGDDELNMWCQGVCAALDNTCTGGIKTSSSVPIIMCCYNFGNYAQCIELCGKKTTEVEFQLFKAKALYQLFQKTQARLRKLQSRADLHKDHHSCYELARETIKIFCHLKDIGFPGFNKECQKMLDFATLDYMLETNKLKELKRCFLCFQKQDAHTLNLKQPIASYEDVSSKEFQQKKFGQRVGVKASHLITEGVVKRLVEKDPTLSTSEKCLVFGVHGTKMDVKRTPATITVHMLCGSCEQMLNRKGEQTFLKFFEKLSDPSFASAKHEFLYGEELYYFAVSLIFRTLCPSQVDYINTNEVYQLLTECRSYLLAEQLTPEEYNKLPHVYLLVHPFCEDDCEESKRTFIEQCSVSYTSKIGLDCAIEQLDSFESVHANFFIVKLGVVIFLVPFKPSTKYVDERLCISPKGGLYTLPAMHDRMDLIPVGIHTVLHILHQINIADLEAINK